MRQSWLGKKVVISYLLLVIGYWLFVVGYFLFFIYCWCRGVAFAPKDLSKTDNLTVQMLRPHCQLPKDLSKTDNLTVAFATPLLPIVNYQLPITHYPLPITHYQSLIPPRVLFVQFSV